MSTIILAEKPQASIKLETALGVSTVAARGHLLGLAKKQRRWNPPYFDIQWTPRKVTKERLESISKKLSAATKIYVGTDFDAEGQLIALNILRYGGIAPSQVQRLKFSSLEREELERAYSNPIDFDVNFALAAETRHFLDWYFGQNISKVLTQIFRKHGIRRGLRALTPIGRVQSPALSFLVEQEEGIKEHVSKEVWYVDVYGVYGRYSDRFFEIRRAWFETKDIAETYTRAISEGTIWEKSEVEFEIEYLPPNKDYIMKEALDQGITAALVDAVLQDLYQDVYISYPRTSSQQYRAHGVDTQKYLKRLVGIIPRAEEAIGKEPREGPEIDVHPAIYPIRPYEEKDLRGIIWKMIAETFVKCHLPPEKHSYPRTEVEIGEETYISTDDPELEEGDSFDLIFKVGKGRTAPPPRYDQAKVYDWMTKERIGTRDTRSQILTKMLRTYCFETEDGIYVTSKGMKIVNVLKTFCPDLIDVDLTRRFESYVETVKQGNSPAKVLEDARDVVTKIVNVLYSKEDEVVKLLR